MPPAGKEEYIFFITAQDYLHVRMKNDAAKPAIQNTAAEICILLCPDERRIKSVCCQEYFRANQHTFRRG